MSRTFQIVNNDGEFAQGDHDIKFDAVGRLVHLTGRDKLIADIQKILFTEENYFYKQYGTIINDLIGTNLGRDTVKETLAKRVTDSLVYLQLLQEQQATYQTVDSAELLGTIQHIAVTYRGDISIAPADVFTFEVYIAVSNQFGDQITLSRNFALSNSSSVNANGN